MGVETKTFRKKLLAASVSSCVLASASAAMAQDEPAVIEEVQVFGIRASVQAAMDIKRDSTGVVDAISAEDIGKMPDANLAESLQRIAGVSISRTNGEGAQVTVRGIDPSLNMVTLNGRNMPAVTNNGTAGDKSSRAYDFANLASESVSGVEVYKTGKAQLAGGGLGAAINLKTLRPLDAGTKISFGGKAVQDTTVYRGEGGEVTPEVSGLFSWANDDDNFGISLTASYQERDNVRSNAFVNNWQLKTAGAADADTLDGTIPAGASVVNAPAAGSLYAVPTDLRYALEDNTRERTNAQLTMQFRPVESVTTTLDYTYSENDLSADRSQQSTWYNVSAITGLQFDTGNAVATPLIYQETYAGGKDVSFAQQMFNSVTQNNSFGANIEWNVTDSFTLQLDYHNSVAKNDTTQYELGLNANVVTGEYSNWSTDLPVMGITFDDSDPSKGNNNGVLDGGDVSGAMGTLAWDNQRASVEQVRVMGDLELVDFIFFDESKLSFGLEAREDVNKALVNKGETPRITMGNWGGVDPDVYGSNWANYFETRDFGTGFDQSGVTGAAEFLDFGLDADFYEIKDALEHTYAQAQNAIKIMGDDPTTVDDPATADEVENVEDYYWVSSLDANGEHWLNRENSLNPDNFNNFPEGKVKPNSHIDVDRSITEEVAGFYFAFTGGFDLGGAEANLGFGVRYEETTLTSAAVTSVPADLQWDGDNDWSLVAGATTEAVVETTTYDNLLPNVDFDVSISDALKLRASYSTTMARPGYDKLKADKSIDDIYQRLASAGNTSLVALESENIDLSAEWYYSEDSYLSAAYFMKDVSNFVGSEVVSSEVYGLRDARAGARYDAAIASGIAANDEAALWDYVCSGTPCGSQSDDPVMAWNLTQPANSNEASIDGVELSVQHWFGDSGFGLQANYTMVDSDLEYDDTSTVAQFALIGLSDTANFVGFYDKDGLQARIAYNWRDEFLSSTTQGGNNAPGYTEAFAQLDFSISYDVTDAVTVSFEGMNVTGEDYRVHGRSDAQMFSFEDLGSRYTAGFRVVF